MDLAKVESHARCELVFAIQVFPHESLEEILGKVLIEGAQRTHENLAEGSMRTNVFGQRKATEVVLKDRVTISAFDIRFGSDLVEQACDIHVALGRHQGSREVFQVGISSSTIAELANRFSETIDELAQRVVPNRTRRILAEETA